jgi:hypothetical protein
MTRRNAKVTLCSRCANFAWGRDVVPQLDMIGQFHHPDCMSAHRGSGRRPPNAEEVARFRAWLLDEARALLQSVTEGQDVLTDRQWMRRAQRLLGET